MVWVQSSATPLRIHAVFALTPLFWSRLRMFLLAENELQLKTGMGPCTAMSRKLEEGGEGEKKEERA